MTTECSICIDDISIFDEETNLNTIHRERTILECQHGFHYECIKKWTLQNLTCPLCRKDITMSFYKEKILKIAKNHVIQIKENKVERIERIERTIENEVNIQNKVTYVYRPLVWLAFLATIVMYSLYIYIFFETNEKINILQNSNETQQNNNTLPDEKNIVYYDLFLLYCAFALFIGGYSLNLLRMICNNYLHSSTISATSVIVDIISCILIPLLYTIFMMNFINQKITNIKEYIIDAQQKLIAIYAIFIVTFVINHIIHNHGRKIIKIIMTNRMNRN